MRAGLLSHKRSLPPVAPILVSKGCIGGISLFIEVFLVGLLAGVSPGPDFVVVMKNSLGYGTAVGVATALGIGMALFIHVSYTIFGYTVLLASHPEIFFGIQFIGALYLAWLGYGAITASKQNSPNPESQHEKITIRRSLLQGFYDGFLCNVLNPKSALFFLSIFAQFLSPGMPEWVKWVYGSEVVAAVVSWFVLLSLLISSAWFQRMYERHELFISRLLGTVLLYLAMRLVFSLGA